MTISDQRILEMKELSKILREGFNTTIVENCGNYIDNKKVVAIISAFVDFIYNFYIVLREEETLDQIPEEDRMSTRLMQSTIDYLTKKLKSSLGENI